MLIRFRDLLGLRTFLFYVGVFTIFISGLGANFEIDLKKIIALSTLSQLGLIITILSLGFKDLSFFHLLTHALFKSLLFLCAGVFIHSIGDIQDIRHLGGAIVSCPVTSFYFMGASMALCGFPFLAGFFSRDLILEVYFMTPINIFMWSVIFLATISTLTYSVRLSYYLFFKNLGAKVLFRIEEHSGIISAITLLFFISVSAGSFMAWLYFPSFSVVLPLLVRCIVLVSLMFLALLVFSLNSLDYIGAVGFYSKSAYFIGSM